MKKRNRMNVSRLFAGIMVVLLFMGNTFTVFAHPHEEAAEVVVIETENVFIDEEGNVYIIDDDVIMPLAVCSHNYVKGTYQNHEKFSDGSCVIRVYEASMCSYCHALILGALIDKYPFPICTH